MAPLRLGGDARAVGVDLVLALVAGEDGRPLDELPLLDLLRRRRRPVLVDVLVGGLAVLVGGLAVLVGGLAVEAVALADAADAVLVDQGRGRPRRHELVEVRAELDAAAVDRRLALGLDPRAVADVELAEHVLERPAGRGRRRARGAPRGVADGVALRDVDDGALAALAAAAPAVAAAAAPAVAAAAPIAILARVSAAAAAPVAAPAVVAVAVAVAGAPIAAVAVAGIMIALALHRVFWIRVLSQPHTNSVLSEACEGNITNCFNRRRC